MNPKEEIRHEYARMLDRINHQVVDMHFADDWDQVVDREEGRVWIRDNLLEISNYVDRIISILGNDYEDEE